ncbi:MAG: histidine kinase [Thermomicrobiales bacterium]
MVLPPPQTKEFSERILALEAECSGELEQSQQSLQEINLLLHKTNQEVEKLSTKELQLSNRVRDMEMHLDNYGRQDIRDLYTASHEVQLRLFMMRSQSEQLQSRHQHIKEYQEKLRILLDLLAVQPVEGSEMVPAGRYTGQLGSNRGTELISQTSGLTIIEAQEDERLRVSRQIHDGPTQTMTNLMLRAEICERLFDRDPAEARSELQGLRLQINQSLQDARRLVFDLRPMILDELGLVPTVQRYVAELQRRKDIDEGTVDGPEYDLRLTTTMQVALFRFIQTGLSAILADGPADAVEVTIQIDEREARLVVAASMISGERTRMEERLEEEHLAARLNLLNAHLITEQRANKGFAVEVVVPIPIDARL